MAMFAGHSGAHGFKSNFSVGTRVAGVTTEADFGFGHADLAPDRFFQVARLQVLISGGVIEARNRGVVTHSALVPVAIALQNPGLRSSTKIPMDRNGNRARTITHAVGAFRSVGFNGIAVRAFANC